MAPKSGGRKRKTEQREAPSEPAAHAPLASLYAATLAACSFLAPKGVLCTLDKLAPTVAALSGGELPWEQARAWAQLLVRTVAVTEDRSCGRRFCRRRCLSAEHDVRAVR